MGQRQGRTSTQQFTSSRRTSITDLRRQSSQSTAQDDRDVRDREDMTHMLQRTFSVDQNMWQKLSIATEHENNRSIFYITRTINPFRAVPIIWMAFIMILDATYTAFLIPWNIAFEAGTYDDYIDIIVGSFFILDFVVSFHMGFLVTLDGERQLIRDGKQVALFYIRRGTFVVDTITVLSYIAQTVIYLSVADRNRTLSFILEAARLIRLVRVSRVIKELFLCSLSGRNLYAMPISSTFIYLLGILYVTLVLVNFLGCIWYFGADISEGGLHESWVASNGLLDEGVGIKYLASIYFSMTTITTVGYGDITPTNPIEQVIAMIMQMIGVVFFGFLVGSATELMSNYSKRARRGTLYREKMMEVQEWMWYRRIPRKLGQRIKQYYGDVWVKQQDYSEQQIVDDLPDDLKADVVYQITRKLLRNLTVFDDLSDELLVQIASHLQPIKRTRGFNLCQQGDEANCIWLLQSGTVRTIVNTEHIDEFVAPDVLGVPSLLSHRDPRCGERMSTYQCVLPCELWQLDLQDLQTLENQIFDLRHRLLQGVKKHLARALSKYGSASKSFQTTDIYNIYSQYQSTSEDINLPQYFKDPSMNQALKILSNDQEEEEEECCQGETPSNQIVGSPISTESRNTRARNYSPSSPNSWNLMAGQSEDQIRVGGTTSEDVYTTF